MWHQIGKDNSSVSIKQAVFCIYITLMAVQIVPIEGFSVSPVKVVAMSLAPLLSLFWGYLNNITNSIFYGIINLLIMIVCALLASSLVAWDRIGYRAMYILMFICVNGIIYDGSITLPFLKRLLVILTISYGIIFIIQHILFLSGIRQVPFLNYYASVTMAGIFKPNGLAIEPSHAARILTVMYWGILKLTEIAQGQKLTFNSAIKELPYCSILFFLSMIAMGSATAMIGILLIFLYFFNRNIVFSLLSLIIFILMMNIEIDNSQIHRIQNVFNSFFSDDVAETLKKKEGSGAVRIMPFINTLRMDFFSLDTWIGQGSIANPNSNFIDRVFSESRYIGDITSFGLLSYIASLVFVFKCCIRKLCSMETLFFLFLATFSVGSVYYTWLMFMIFAAIKYFENQALKRMNSKQ